MDAKYLIEKSEHYYELAEKNYRDYQQSGDPRYERRNRNYEELADVYRKAGEMAEEEDTARTRRLQNMSAFINDHIKQLHQQTYTKAEVLELAERMKQFLI